jgi:hypothetical protein
VFVYYKVGSAYKLFHNYNYPELVYIAGEFGNELVGVCNQQGANFVGALIRNKAFIFNIDGQNTRKLILPYDRLSRTRNKKLEFKFLRILVCNGTVLVEHTWHARKGVEGNSEDGKQAKVVLELCKIHTPFIFYSNLVCYHTLNVIHSNDRLTIMTIDLLSSYRCDENYIYFFKRTPFMAQIYKIRQHDVVGVRVLINNTQITDVEVVVGDAQMAVKVSRFGLFLFRFTAFLKPMVHCAVRAIEIDLNTFQSNTKSISLGIGKSTHGPYLTDDGQVTMWPSVGTSDNFAKVYIQ